MKHPTPNPELIILYSVINNGDIKRETIVITAVTSRKYFGTLCLKANKITGVSKNNRPSAFSSNSKFRRSNMYTDSIKSPTN